MWFNEHRYYFSTIRNIFNGEMKTALKYPHPYPCSLMVRSHMPWRTRVEAGGKLASTQIITCVHTCAVAEQRRSESKIHSARNGSNTQFSASASKPRAPNHHCPQEMADPLTECSRWQKIMSLFKYKVSGVKVAHVEILYNQLLMDCSCSASTKQYMLVRWDLYIESAPRCLELPNSCEWVVTIVNELDSHTMLEMLIYLFFWDNRNMYICIFHFLSFLNGEMVQIVEILPQWKRWPNYCTYSISWLLMPWRCKEPGH